MNHPAAVLHPLSVARRPQNHQEPLPPAELPAAGHHPRRGLCGAAGPLQLHRALLPHP